MISLNSKKFIFLLFSLIFLSVSLQAFGNENKINRIEILVNENVITNYDIIQRMKMNAILNQVEINNENYNQLINSVIDDLIMEKLKNEKVSEYNINFDDKELKNHKERFYSNINFEETEIKEAFIVNDVNYDYLKEFFETELKWQKLIYGLYLRVTSVTDQEIEDLISKNPNLGKEIAKEIILQQQLDIKSSKLIKDLKEEATIEYKW